MAFQIPGFSYTLEAAGDLSAEQFTFMTAAGGDATQAGAGVASVGVLQNNPAAAGREAALMATGISKVVAGAAVSVNARVASDANGEAVTAAMGDVVNGIALQPATAQGEIIAVLLTLGGGQVN